MAKNLSALMLPCISAEFTRQGWAHLQKTCLWPRNFDNFAIYLCAGDSFEFRGMGLRKVVIGLLCLAALAVSGCAKKDPTVARVEGSEPQRLAFGTPVAVQKSFADQMKICWFSGPSALLTGYQYDTKPSAIETSDGLVELQQISIFSGQGQQAQIFIVQFHAFNENTLISTRNLTFPAELAAKLKQDVETWIFGRGECKESVPPAGYAGVPTLAPQSSSIVQHSSTTSGWSPK